MSDDDDGPPEDFGDVDVDDDIFGESLPSEPSAGPAAKAPGRSPSQPPSNPPSKPPSKAPSELGAEDSLFASGSLLASRPASKAPSVADSFGRSHDTLGGAPRSIPPAPAAVAPGSKPSSLRGSKAGSIGRPASPLGTAPSDDFADLIGPSPERSTASLPRGGGPPSTSGSGFGAPVGAAGPASVSGGSRPGTASRFSPGGSVAASAHGGAGSRAGSVSGFGALGSVGTGSFTASMGRGGLAPPEASPSPRASGAATPRAHFAAGSGGGGASGPRPLLRNDKSRRSHIECHIPTPFELFRLYDMDLNGRVTREEFYDMLRDLDALPLHYTPEDDPEHRLVGLRAKRQSKANELEAREEKLSLAEMHRQATEAFKRELREELAKLAGKVAELDAKIEEEEQAARALTRDPDESVRVTPELRQHRAQWRKWVQEEFTRADLAGNGILSIDEFYMYFYSKLCFRFPVMRTGVNPGALLFNIFVRYCSLGRGAVGGRYEDMLCHQFAKLCRDAGLINGKTVTKAAVDIVYHRSRAADESLETFKPKPGVAATARMYYPQFLFALDKIADKRRSGFQEVVAKVLSSIDTLPEPSFADFLIISGDELEAGAPVPEFLTRPSLLPDNRAELQALADNDMIRKMKEESRDALNLTMGMVPKSDAEGGLKAFLEAKRAGEGQGADGQPQGDVAAAAAAGSAHSAARAPQVQASVYGNLPPPSLGPETLRQRKWERPEPSELSQSRAAAVARGMAPVLSPDTMHLVRGLDPDQLMASLKRVYEAYTAWGGGVDRGALDRRRFAKVLRDAMLVSESSALPIRKAEAVYDKVLPASSRALNFLQFIEALRHVALHLRLSLNEVMEKIVAVGSPRPGP